jgi:3-deoxy-D-manno-octulosonate 8-phosphate phosphatase (KDO 8-P phosphatase)
MSIESLKLIAVDVDGTLTDGNYYVGENGKIHKNFHTRDSYALNQAKNDGFKILIITGATDDIHREKFGYKYDVISGSRDKLVDLSKYLQANNMTWEDVAYIGDAENDYRCILEAGFPSCPSDAVPEVVEHSAYVANASGGKGAVYEIIRYIYKLRKMPWPM